MQKVVRHLNIYFITTYIFALLQHILFNRRRIDYM